MSAKEDALYSWLNDRGRKNFKPTDRAQLTERFPAYGKIGLPAHKAALEGNIEALKEIYTAFTADGVPSRDVNGATPLHLAVRSNRTEAVKWMLRFTDLSPTTAAKHGETPCHVAAVLGNTECLKAMLGADVRGEICTASDNSGFTALHLAIVKSRNEVAKMLMSELGAKATGAVGESGITAAHVAASSGNTEVMKIIVNKNRKYLSQQTTDGTTPVYYAAQEGRLAVLKYLHEKGKCDLSSPSNDGRKPIHAACQCGHTHVVKFIVSQSNNSAIFETVPDGATTLHFAASTGQLKTVQWLIDSDVGGTLVNSKDNGGDTPAHDAADNGHTDVLKLLLESGADLYAINNDGNTPYSLALSNQEHGMADFVMAFASNAPQKQEERPSQMTIFDMQGEVDVVDLPTEKQEVTVEAEVEVEVEKDVGECVREEKPVMMNKKEEKKLKKKEKEKEKKEKKQKDKKGKKDANSSSYLGSPGTALLSIPTNANNKEVTGGEGDDKVLDMTEEELDMFREDHKADDSANNLIPKAPPSSDGSDIVVSYGDTTPPVKSKLSRSRLPPPPETIATSDYSTVAEIERAEQKKEKKKKGRKSSKSIQKQKHKEDSSKNIEGAGAILSGPQMGFKPQFRTNPLQQLSAGAPPTPPPTPATGISSSAASEAGMVSTEDEDDMPYDMYTDDVGDRQARDKGESEERDKGESEEKQDDRAGKREHEQEEMLDQMQENAITDLDDEEDEEEEDKKPVLKKWPPQKPVDYKPADAKIQPSGENVLKKWQQTSDSTPASPEKPAVPDGKGRGNVLKKWPPAASSEPKPPSPKEPTTRFIAETSSPLPSPTSHTVSESESAEKEKLLPVKLRPVQNEAQKSWSPLVNGDKQRELDNIKLRKATKTVGCTTLRQLIFVMQGAIPRQSVNWTHVSETEYLRPAMQRATFLNTQLTDGMKLQKLKNYFKFVMIRNPLEQLVSAYRDKIEPPLELCDHDKWLDPLVTDIHRGLNMDYFQAYRRLILSKYHPHLLIEWAHGNGNYSLSVDFTTYVKWITDTEDRDLNEHFSSILFNAAPCRVEYHLYLNFKNYSREVRLLIEKLNTNSEYFIDHNSHGTVQDETHSKLPYYYSQLSDEMKRKLFVCMYTELDFLLPPVPRGEMESCGSARHQQVV